MRKSVAAFDLASAKKAFADVQRSRNACMSFIGIFTFAAVFTVAQLGHHRAGIAFELTQTFEAVMTSVNPMPASFVSLDLHVPPYTKRLNSVSSFDDMFEWLAMSYLPPFWEEGPHGRGFVKGFNRIVGGVRLKQLRLSRGSCPGGEARSALHALYNASCHSSQLDTSAVSSLGPSTPAADGLSYHNYWLDVEQNWAEVQSHLQHLQDASWLSTTSQEVAVEITFYNAELGMFILTTVKFEKQRTGQLRIFKNIEFLPELVYGNGWLSLSLWADVWVFLTLSILTLIELYQVVVAFKSGTLMHHFTLYKIATICVILGGYGISFFFTWLSQGMNTVEDRFASMETALADRKVLAGSAYEPGLEHDNAILAYHTSLARLYDDIGYYAWTLRYSQLATFWYSLVLLVKFFEGFQANQHLSIIINMFKLAFPDLVHFFIIFIVVFINFAVGAHLLFGHRLQEWSSPVRSFNAGFRCLMGDFDQQGIYAIAPTSSTAWFWLYMTVIYLVLLNVFIAIILDGYERAKPPEGSDSDGLLQSFTRTFSSLTGRLSGARRSNLDNKDGIDDAGSHVSEQDADETSSERGDLSSVESHVLRVTAAAEGSDPGRP